jgi:hypothetical protein
MGLKNGGNGFSRMVQSDGMEYGADFIRMVRVIIDVGAMRLSNVVGESAMNPAECSNAFQAFNAVDSREVG